MSDNVIRFPVRAVGDLTFSDEGIRELLASFDARIADRSTPPVEAWLEQTSAGGSGCYLLTLVFPLDPATSGFAIDSAATFEPMAGYTSWPLALAAATFTAEHYDVPLVDHTGPQAVA